MRTISDSVLLVPLTEKGIIVSKTASGIPFVGNYDHLVKSVALADGPDGIRTGDTVYVSGTQVKQPWAKIAYDLGNGVVGVLAPRAAIVLVDPAVKNV
jgi:hypothetical protein